MSQLIYLELELSLVLVMLLGTGMASIEMCQKESSCSCVTDSNLVTDLSDLRAVYFSVYVRDNSTVSEYRLDGVKALVILRYHLCYLTHYFYRNKIRNTN